MIPDKLLVHAFKKLDELELNGTLTEKDVKNWDVFIECAKQYHDCYKNLKFKSDYSEIIKVETLTFKETLEQFKTYKKHERRTSSKTTVHPNGN